MLFRPVILRSPEDGKGGGAGGENQPGTPPATTPGTGAPPSGTGNDPGNTNSSNNGNPPAGAITFASEAEFQKALDEKLKDRLERERKKSEDVAKKAVADAAAEAAKKNGEWQVLAEQREKELSDLQTKLNDFEPSQQRLQRYEEALKKNLEAQRTGLPEPIIKLLDKLDVAEQLEWLAANKEVILKKSPDGINPTPPANGNLSSDALKNEKEKFSKRTRSFF